MVSTVQQQGLWFSLVLTIIGGLGEFAGRLAYTRLCDGSVIYFATNSTVNRNRGADTANRHIPLRNSVSASFSSVLLIVGWLVELTKMIP